MKTSVFIQSKSIQVLCGNLRKNELHISDWHNVPISDDAVVNGVIVNDTSIKVVLTNLKEKLGRAMKEVCLVIDSNSIFARQLTVPVLPHAKIIKLVESEFSDIDNRGELLFDYMVLKNKNPNGNGGIILASAVEKSFIESYVRIFAEAGIKLSSIDLATAAVIRFASTENIKNKTCVVAILDGNTINVSLFVDGIFRMFNHSRLFQERGSLSSASEITQLISSLIQFNQAEKTGREISAVYFGGLESNEIRTKHSGAFDGAEYNGALCERITESLGISVSEFPLCAEIKVETTGKRRAFPIADFICSCGNLLSK